MLLKKERRKERKKDGKKKRKDGFKQYDANRKSKYLLLCPSNSHRYLSIGTINNAFASSQMCSRHTQEVYTKFLFLNNGTNTRQLFFHLFSSK